MSLQEAAAELGVHYMTVYRYVRTGRLYAEKQGREYLVDVADVRRLRDEAARTPRRQGAEHRRELLLDRLIVADEPGSWRIVEDALVSGMSPERVYLELLAPVLVWIGDAWADGDVSVADEHRASAVAGRLVGRLGPRFARRGPKRGTVVVGSPSGERHALPSAMLADILRGAGYHTIDLGADTPGVSFIEAAGEADRLVAVLVGVTTLDHDRAVRSVMTEIRSAGLAAPLMLGGAGTVDDAHARRLGADGWTGHDAAQALEVVEGHERSTGR